MRASHEAAAAWREARNGARRALQHQQAAHAMTRRATATLVNGVNPWKTPEDEQAARQDAVEQQMQVYRVMLPVLLTRLGAIRDPRHPKLVRHTSTSLLIYGIVTFVFHMASRRDANRQMTMPMFRENLKPLCPDIDTVPHQDTLNRLLADLDVDQIEATLLALVERCIRQKKFARYLRGTASPVAIDGTQKLVRNWCWDPQCLERQVSATGADGTVTKRPQYDVYVLEATLAFANGLTIPRMSEFLTDAAWDGARSKQDCETKAFQRLATRLKARFPRLPMLILLDGLYATGPVMAICRTHHWAFMIVLRDDSLPSVWEEVRGLKRRQPRHRLDQTWGDRHQHFWWVNEIEYRYGARERRRHTVHVVVCDEHWSAVDPTSLAIVDRQARHAWVSSEPLTRATGHERCNLGARHRWGIESHFLVEKRHGYQYEHGFSETWQAMKGYHFLMQLGHLLNILACHTEALGRLVARFGFRGLLRWLRDTCSGPWLDRERLRAWRHAPCQLRLA